MSRATAVYLTMIVALVGGLWAVLAAGAGLTAPDNLDGRWVAGFAGPRCTWPGMTVQQSGRYFELAFDKGPAMGATMIGRGGEGPLTLARGPWRVTVDAPAAPGGTRTFHVDGPAPGTFTGHRDVRPTTGPSGR